jgi:hypothetical protein
MAGDTGKCTGAAADAWFANDLCFAIVTILKTNPAAGILIKSFNHLLYKAP